MKSLASAFLIVFFTHSFPEALIGATLTLKGMPIGRGPLVVSVYKDGESWLKSPQAVFTKKVPGNSNSIQIELDLKPGEYAIHTFQDQNNNGKLDMKWLPPGPKEPWVVTNNAQGTIGPPSFEDAKVVLSQDSRIELQLQIP